MRSDLVQEFLAKLPWPAVFVTVSGAHLYGFSSPDSDYDLRGCHVTSARAMLTLDPPSETVEIMDKDAPVEMDVVTHDVRKFFKLLLGKNGYVLEQIFSPLVAFTTPEHEELKVIARACITKHHHYHYTHFARTQWEAVVKSGKPTVKGLLYTYRVLLAGIHLMRTGDVEANLVVLNREANLSPVQDLIQRKLAGAEKQALGASETERHEHEYARLQGVLEEAQRTSSLPDAADPVRGRGALDDLLVRLRMRNLG